MDGAIFQFSNGTWVGALLFTGILIMLELGHRLGRRQRELHGEHYGDGLGSVEGALFALLGLLVAFTFSGAAERLDQRRHLIVEEANEIGTAYLRIDLLPAEYQPPVREKFRQYVDARIAFYRDIGNSRDMTNLYRSDSLQKEIWALAIAGEQAAPTTVPGMLLLNSLNGMFDITTTRTWAMQMHPPVVIMYLLMGMSLCCALFAGYGMSAAPRRNWLHRFLFAFVMAGAIYVILDLEFPRRGFIRVDAFDRALVEERAKMQ